MFRPFRIALILAGVCNCYSQQVTVLTSTISGIASIGPQSPDFAASVAQIVGTDQPSNFTAWLPYGVVIKNNSSQVLAAITVAWTEALNATSPLHQAGLNYGSAFNGPPSRQVQPGQAVLELPQHELLQPRDLKGFSPGRGMGNLQNYQQAQRIQISVDAVVFASGQFVGADTYREYEEYQAEINAPRSVSGTVLERKATAPISDILAWLQTLAAQPRGGDFTTQRSRNTARQLLDLYSRKGEIGLYSTAQSIVQAPAFPLPR